VAANGEPKSPLDPLTARLLAVCAFEAGATGGAEAERLRLWAWLQQRDPWRYGLLIPVEPGTPLADRDLLPSAALCAGALGAAERDARAMRTQLRLLRMSIDLHRGRDVPPLPDPLGDGPLRVRHTSTGVRLHSAAAEQNPQKTR
jgi:hypothetical protein